MFLVNCAHVILHFIFASTTTVPPKVTPVANETIGLITMSVHLQFSIEEATPPVALEDIFWMFGDSELQEDGEHVMFSANRLSVTITNLSLSDGGVYSLTATNPAGSDSAHIMVEVQGMFGY